MNLPQPSPEALVHSEALKQDIARSIAAEGGWISFARFMELALYAPGKGYYSGGAQKFGAAGDFVTAPEISPLFGQALAAQAEQAIRLSAPQVIEVGAGSGQLAADLLRELERRDALPERYAILDLSGDLRQRQQQTLMRQAPHLLERITWLDRIPAHFDGLVLANELLDAMPVHLVLWGSEDDPAAILERGVGWEHGTFVWRDRPANGRVLEQARGRAAEVELPPGYLSEIALAPGDWTATWGSVMGRGILLLIDYGFPRHEFFHPQRSGGTLMCHYRHRAHGDPLILPGIQDITAHVDFTAVAEAGFDAGLDVLGYTTQAAFLLNCGLTNLVARQPQDDAVAHLRQTQAAQKLISPAEMGELFKVIALGKGCSEPLLGFAQGNRIATL